MVRLAREYQSVTPYMGLGAGITVRPELVEGRSAIFSHTLRQSSTGNIWHLSPSSESRVTGSKRGDRQIGLSSVGGRQRVRRRRKEDREHKLFSDRRQP